MMPNDAMHQLVNRIKDLILLSDKRCQVSYTEFLDMAEASTAIAYLKSIHRDYELLGGYEACERKLVLIYPEYAFQKVVKPDPLRYIEVTPANNRFSRLLSHRDYLGALMNLGIERRVLGDILLNEDHAVIICMAHIEEFILSNLIKVGQSDITLQSIVTLDEAQYQRDYQTIRNTVASLRLDSIVKVCANVSRGDGASLIRCGKVFVNGSEATKTSTLVEENTILSIRGYGKFKVRSIGNRTKKDRLIVEIDKYI